jgi:hypothetical protein
MGTRCAAVVWLDSVMIKPGWVPPDGIEAFRAQASMVHVSVGMVSDGTDYIMLFQSASAEWQDGRKENANLIKIPRVSVLKCSYFDVDFGQPTGPVIELPEAKP